MATDEIVEVENWVQERVLGSGGFGTVTLWRNKTTSDLIALKKCRTGTDVLLTPKHKERWAKEVEIMKRLNHPNVVKSVEVPVDLAGLRSELPLMCMEFCSKGDLRQVLNKSENCCGLQENDVRALISDVKSAVQYLHLMKITHRDLKPENIVLQETDNKIVYKLIDLGYAKELDQSSICTSFVGTLQYLAPELFLSKKYTCSVDYWSLGLVSHEVITGVRPFLPNMSPAAWMTHVKDKSSDHICAYQDLDGSVVFSSELCHQNHISSTLKYHLERWLKLLLEWDPSKRGRAPGKNDIVVFDLIEEILNKKVITVFCVPTFKYLSYEIDDSTALTTLKCWIERDTGLPVTRQELMLPTGQPPDIEKEAIQCLVSPHKQSQSGAMLYVYKQGSLKVEHDTPRVPPFVAKMLEEPKGLMEYVHQKRTWAYAVFFLQQELQLFTALLLAYKIKLHNLIINSTKLKQQAHSVVNQLHEAKAHFSLSSDSLAFDEEYAKKYTCFSTKMAFWNKVNSGLAMKMNKLTILVKQLEAKCESVQRKTLELQHTSCLNAASYDALISYVESGLKCYENLRRRPKEIRQRKTNNLEMARIVYHCLKERYIFLKDEPSLEYLKQLLGVQGEMSQLWSPLSKTQIEITKAITEIKQAQLERQHSIWAEITLPEQCNGTLPINHGISPEFIFPSLVPSITDPEFPLSSSPAPSLRRVSPEPRSASADDSQQQSLMDSICGVTNANVDASTMISHNKHLRYMTQDLLTESFQQHVKLLEEGTSLDWTFLNTQEDQ